MCGGGGGGGRDWKADEGKILTGQRGGGYLGVGRGGGRLTKKMGRVYLTKKSNMERIS